jgi:hypothetical protein
MTTASGVAVVATQLAQTDRRALSQAWYSALHLAQTAPTAPHDGRAATPTERPAVPPRERSAAPARATHDATFSPPRAVRAHALAAPLVDRRSAPSVATRRVERALATIARAPSPPASHTIAIEGGRVTLLVRTGNGATRIVALCREPLRATVERALARARFTLAAP